MSSARKRIRVVHVGKFYPPVSGGMERVLQLVCERERGEVDTRVIVANSSPDTVQETVEGVPVTRVGNYGMVGSVALCPTFPYWLRRARADVIVIHEPNPIGLLAYTLARPSGRVVIWFHSEVVRDRWQYELFYRPWLAHVMRRTRRIIVASPPMADVEQLTGFAAPRSVIPYGVDERRLALTADVQTRVDGIRRKHPGPLVLFVGRLVPYKGVDVLLRALQDVRGTVALVGDGPQREPLESLARQLGVQDRVVFCGETDESDLVAWYHACDVFTLPSVTRAEAFGVVQTEAMACGKPVISTSVPSGVPWVNRDNETGFVVPPADASALATALNRLLTDEPLRRRLGEAGRRRVADEFTADRMASRAMELYAQVLAGPGAPAVARPRADKVLAGGG